MRVYLINLDRRPDRLARMTAEFERAGIGFERIPAVDATDAEVQRAAEATLPGRFGRPMEPAEFAIFQSHRTCWRALVASDAGHAMIFEDDVIVEGDLAGFIGSGWIPSDADIVRMETYLTRVHLERRAHRLGEGRRALHRVRSEQLGAACYTISRGAAERLLALSDTIEEPVDNFLFSETAAGFRSSAIYQMVPAPVVQGNRVLPRQGRSVPDWAVSSLKDSRDAKYLGPHNTESRVQRLRRRLIEELRALFLGTRYVVVPPG